jgi:hypothetical protein
MLRIISLPVLAGLACGFGTQAAFAQTLDSGSGLVASQKVNTPPPPARPSTPVVTNPAAGGGNGVQAAPSAQATLKHSCAARKGSAVSMNRTRCRH